jgi:predicted ATP-dependent serine protease
MGWTMQDDVNDTLRKEGPEGVRARHDRARKSDGKTQPQPQQQQQQQQPPPPESAAEIKRMTFSPIKYVVPGVIVEGLTLLAGKPKLGKSWLLLHAAIAVARSGFTLGEIHCVKETCFISRWKTTNAD